MNGKLGIDLNFNPGSRARTRFHPPAIDRRLLNCAVNRPDKLRRVRASCYSLFLQLRRPVNAIPPNALKAAEVPHRN
jgi:hypothetical protein